MDVEVNQLVSVVVLDRSQAFFQSIQITADDPVRHSSCIARTTKATGGYGGDWTHSVLTRMGLQLSRT